MVLDVEIKSFPIEFGGDDKAVELEETKITRTDTDPVVELTGVNVSLKKDIPEVIPSLDTIDGVTLDFKVRF